MRTSIDEALKTPGPVFTLQQEANKLPDETIEALKSLDDHFKNPKMNFDRAISIDRQGSRTFVAIRKNADALSDILVNITVGVYFHDIRQNLPKIIQNALYAAENHETLPLSKNLIGGAIAEALMNSFYAGNSSVEPFENEKSIELASPFSKAKIYTPDGPRFRAEPQWTREFIDCRVGQDTSGAYPFICLFPLNLRLESSESNADPVTRLWAAAQTDLFIKDPGNPA